jgi:protein subunit release factor A
VRLTDVERQIHELETRLEALATALGNPALYSDGARVREVSGERKTAEEKMAWLMREWETLSTELAGHE